MVTGDQPDTAKAIAVKVEIIIKLKCKLISDADLTYDYDTLKENGMPHKEALAQCQVIRNKLLHNRVSASMEIYLHR